MSTASINKKAEFDTDVLIMVSDDLCPMELISVYNSVSYISRQYADHVSSIVHSEGFFEHFFDMLDFDRSVAIPKGSKVKVPSFKFEKAFVFDSDILSSESDRNGSTVTYSDISAKRCGIERSLCDRLYIPVSNSRSRFFHRIVNDRTIYNETRNRGVHCILGECKWGSPSSSVAVCDLLASNYRLPVCAVKIKGFRSSLGVLGDMCNVREMQSIFDLLEYIASSRLVISGLCPISFLSSLIGVPTVIAEKASLVSRYFFPYQPHIFIAEDARQLDESIKGAMEFYETM